VGIDGPTVGGRIGRRHHAGRPAFGPVVSRHDATLRVSASASGRRGGASEPVADRAAQIKDHAGGSSHGGPKPHRAMGLKLGLPARGHREA
jgi:hypothetical protein